MQQSTEKKTQTFKEKGDSGYFPLDIEDFIISPCREWSSERGSIIVCQKL